VSLAVDYFFSPASPYAYPGHERFAAIANPCAATLRILPGDLGRFVARRLARG
jgi:2-hydroxychromene-2-carboxylate isomerase